MTKTQGVPQIDSEVIVGLALLRWSPRQFSDYARAIGYSLSPESVEDAMSVPLSRFELLAPPSVVGCLRETFKSLGLGFQHDVFGVTRRRFVRASLSEDCLSSGSAISVLLDNLETPQITLGVQAGSGCDGSRTLLLLVETPYSTSILFDVIPLSPDDLEQLVTLLYSAWLARLSVIADCVDDLRNMDVEEAAKILLDNPSLPASTLSRARTMQLLLGVRSHVV